MTRPFRIAVVGAGRCGMLHAVNASRWVPGVELACIVDAGTAARNAAVSALGVPGYAALDQALAADSAGLDGVVITTPTFTHEELGVLAAQAGLHVFCEKPMALTLAGCDAMDEAARRAGVVLAIGFVRRCQPEFAEARRRIEAGDIGEPMVIKSLTRGPGLPPPWAHDLSLSNGMLAEVNSHDFDCVRWLAGAEIDRVYAETANVKGAQRGVAAAGFYDNAVVTLRLAGGILATIDGTCPADYGYDARVEVLGTDGLLAVGESRAAPLLEIRDRGSGTVPTYVSWQQRFEPGYREELRAFAAAAREGAAPPAGAADGRAAVAAVLAANQSWLEERPVPVARLAQGPA
jgi:scyllo-inositol 2-dehydrogenase (NAD+)